MREFKFDIDDWTGGDTIGNSMGDAVGSTVDSYDIKLVTAPTNTFESIIASGVKGRVDWGDGTEEILDGSLNKLTHTFKDGNNTKRFITFYIKDIKSLLNIISNYGFTEPILTIKRFTPYEHTKLEEIHINAWFGYVYSAVKYEQDVIFDDKEFISVNFVGNNITTFTKDVFSKMLLDETFSIPETVTSLESGAFHSAEFSSDLVIPDSVTNIDVFCFNNVKLNNNKIVLPNNINHIKQQTFANISNWNGDLVIPDSVKTISTRAFEYNSANGKLILGNGLKLIKGFAFADCSKLTGKLTIPASIERIEIGAFADCRSIKHLEFEEGNLKTLNANLFNNCRSITNDVKIPRSVTALEDFVFYDCVNIKNIYVPNHIKNIPSRFCSNNTKIIKY